MNQLAIKEGDIVVCQNVSLPLATFSKFQPQSVDFLDITNPKAVYPHLPVLPLSLAPLPPSPLAISHGPYSIAPSSLLPLSLPNFLLSYSHIFSFCTDFSPPTIFQHSFYFYFFCFFTFLADKLVNLYSVVVWRANCGRLRV